MLYDDVTRQRLVPRQPVVRAAAVAGLRHRAGARRCGPDLAAGHPDDVRAARARGGRWPGVLACWSLAPRMPARTAKGTALLAQAKGFRMYLETAEADQIRFEEGEDIFSRYLPFAIVFGVAERWAKVFAAARRAAAWTSGAPTWYVGHGYAGPAFNYAAFGQCDGLLHHRDLRLDRRGDAVLVRFVRVRRGRVLRRRWRRWWRRLLVRARARLRRGTARSCQALRSEQQHLAE